jgi:hypothetical protein
LVISERDVPTVAQSSDHLLGHGSFDQLRQDADAFAVPVEVVPEPAAVVALRGALRVATVQKPTTSSAAKQAGEERSAARLLRLVVPEFFDPFLECGEESDIENRLVADRRPPGCFVQCDATTPLMVTHQRPTTKRRSECLRTPRPVPASQVPIRIQPLRCRSDSMATLDDQPRRPSDHLRLIGYDLQACSGTVGIVGEPPAVWGWTARPSAAIREVALGRDHAGPGVLDLDARHCRRHGDQEAPAGG